ncbi:MAG TPA: hypothetical protein ENG63_07025 [Candidatus Desulfofervidus auxilii]|uniref:Uncharacterized protein n=1 Tax=Desulfofervidus auxilii TaxID=1621989 RepID=A0A7C0U3F2_DESA2|nr:hypothetical protein [Candidatus Desulfofervidus auxilii]
MAKLRPEEVSLIDVAVCASSPSCRTATTPFGAPPGGAQRYVGRPVPWKNNPEAMPSGVRSGLAKAIDYSRACRGVKGVCVVRGKVMPCKAKCQMEHAGKL